MFVLFDVVVVSFAAFAFYRISRVDGKFVLFVCVCVLICVLMCVLMCVLLM